MGEPTLDLSGSHVAILGWAGSSTRQLRGIGRFYRRREVRGVIPHSATIWRAMGTSGGWAHEGRELAAAIREADPESLVVHVFSNAGFWTWAATLQTLETSLLARVRAVVMDSAPGVPERIEPLFYAHHATRAMVPIALASLGRPPSQSHPLLTPAVWAFMRFYYHVSPKQIAWSERSTQLAIDVGDWDHLLLYSAADRLVAPHYVEAFAHRLRAAGRHVETQRWEQSAHVRHMISHRAEYFDRIGGFLAERLD